MNSPDRQQPSSGPDDRPISANAPSLSLKAYVEREAATIAATGPTMAEILEGLDRHRRSDGPTTEDIVNALHEGRREQSAHDSRGDSS
jgi:antitoxin FitA